MLIYQCYAGSFLVESFVDEELARIYADSNNFQAEEEIITIKEVPVSTLSLSDVVIKHIFSYNVETEKLTYISSSIIPNPKHEQGVSCIQSYNLVKIIIINKKGIKETWDDAIERAKIVKFDLEADAKMLAKTWELRRRFDKHGSCENNSEA